MDYLDLLLATMSLAIPTFLVFGALFLVISYPGESYALFKKIVLGAWSSLKKILFLPFAKKFKKKKVLAKKEIEKMLDAEEEVRLPMEQVLYLIRHWNDYNFFSSEDGKVAVKKIKEVLEQDLVLDGKELVPSETPIAQKQKGVERGIEYRPPKAYDPKTMTQKELEELHQKAFYVDEHFYVERLDAHHKLVVDGVTWKVMEGETRHIVAQGNFKDEEQIKKVKQEHRERTSKKHADRRAVGEALEADDFAPTDAEISAAKEAATLHFPPTMGEDEDEKLIKDYEAALAKQPMSKDEEKGAQTKAPEEKKNEAILFDEPDASFDPREIAKSLSQKKAPSPAPQKKVTSAKESFYLTHEFHDAKNFVDFFLNHNRSTEKNMDDFFLWLAKNFPNVFLQEKEFLLIPPSSFLCAVASTIKEPTQRNAFLDHFFLETSVHFPNLDELLGFYHARLELTTGIPLFDRYKREENYSYSFKLGVLSKGKKWTGLFLRIRANKKALPFLLREKTSEELTLCEVLAKNAHEVEAFGGKEISMLKRKEAEKCLILS